ncbi:MAG: hypothetical protein ACT4OY_00895 [Alphaproteobacteria bacterium]
MIGPVNPQNPVSAGQKPNAGPVLRWAKNDRTAGSIPVWENPVSAKERAAQNLSYALAAPDGGPDNALAYRPQEATKPGEAFGFADLLDMINPLQHIPGVGHIYREMTGDQIRPAGRVIGGALFGGFIGAGAGLVNVIAEKETGADVTGNAMNFVSGRKSFQKNPEIKYTIAAYNAARPRYNE